MFHKIKLALTLGSLSLIASCGGGGSSVSQTADGWQVSSGIAQKGPLLRGSSVTVAELSTTTLQPSGKTYPFEVLDDSGTFKPTNITFTSSYLESTALGYYFNELTGQKSSDMVFLRGLSNLATGQDTAVNVNVLSSFTDKRIKNLFNIAPKKTFAVARPQAEKELLAGFYIYNAVDLMPGTTTGGIVQPKTFMELDLSKKRAADQILAAMSAVVVNAGQTGSGVNYLINQIETDLADDGLLNNSTKFPVSVASQLGSSVQITDFAAAARNLNAFYGTTYTATELSQWVDTSGGVDQVIDKYKFSYKNAQSGVESKSPIYVAGTEDAGQCFTVSKGKLYKSNVLQVSPVKAVKGDSFAVGLTGSDISFIQRFAPVNGVCPSLVPTAGLIRVQKYTVTFANAVTSLAAGNITMHALKSDGSIFGWGYNGAGEVGNGQSANNILSPVQAGTGFAKIAQGQQQGIGIKNDGTLWIWGDWGFNNTLAPSLLDSNVYISVSAGHFDGFAIRSDNTLWAIGDNFSGQLGDGTTINRTSLVQIGTGFNQVTTSQLGYFSLAIKTDGSLWAWGSNQFGQLGNGTKIDSTIPIKIDAGPWKAITALQGASYGLKADGTLWTWGFTGSTVPTQVGINTYKKISGGNSSMAAIDINGYLWQVSIAALTPTKFGIDTYIDVAVGTNFTIALQSDNKLWAWGDNSFGQLGQGNTNLISNPVQISPF